uniref:ARID domain-containing protein n=1 Tax=Quercus lobata TaxID=97700 RepID=A0A7N2MN06_QUELO
MTDHQREADRTKGKELATTSSESSPLGWSTYNAHFVRLAIEKVACPGTTDITDREIFFDTVRQMQDIVTKEPKLPTLPEELDLHRLFLEVISRGGKRKIEKEGLWEEVRDVIYPNMAVSDLLDLYDEYLLHYCEDFIVQNNAASEQSSTTTPAEAHQRFRQRLPAAQGPCIATEKRESNFYPDLPLTSPAMLNQVPDMEVLTPPTMLPNHSSSLWAMADSWFPINTQAKISQQQQQNILSAPCSSSIPTEEEVAEGLRLLTESIPEWYWDKSLDPQLDAVASSDLAPTMSSTARTFPTQGEVGTELLLTQAESASMPERDWNMSLDSQLDAVKNPDLTQPDQGMCPHTPSNSKYEQLVLFISPELNSTARPIEARLEIKPRLTLAVGQVTPTSQRKVSDSLPTDDLANAEKKKLKTEAAELQPSAPSEYNISVKEQWVSSDRPGDIQMKAEESGSLKEAEKSVDNQKAVEDKRRSDRNISMTEILMQKAKAEIHCNVGSGEKAKPEGEKDVDKSLNMELLTGATHGRKGISGKGYLEGEKTAD